MLAGLLADAAFAQDGGAGEYEIKAAFLLDFARFTEWSPSAFSNATQPLVIGIIGQDPFDSEILDGLSHKKFNGRAVTIRHFKRAPDIDVCHVLFVGSVKDKELPVILDAIKDRGILTVGESAGFLAAGGMIRFLFQDEKIRFEVNLRTVENTSVKLSSRLLGVAITVRQ